MKILITGAAGFVGSHVVARIAARFPDAAIVTADLIEPGEAALAAWNSPTRLIECRRLDVTDRAAVQALIAETRPSHVVHAAAVTPVLEEEMARPARILDVNFGGTLNVVDAATALPGLARLLVFSSAAVYGNASDLPDPISETTTLRPTTLYGIAKAAGEDLVRRYASLRGVSAVNVRIAGAYGQLERPSGSRDRMSQIHRLARAVTERRAVSVHGPDVPRDWVHADDIGDAVAGLLAAPALAHDVYNIGSGRVVGWHETVRRFAEAGLDVRWAGEAEQADVALAASESRPALAIDRLRTEIGYAPRPFRDGLVSLLPGART